jgi:hypothetical protein
MFFQRNKESELEAKLRHGRPQPGERLVDEIASHIEGDRTALRPRTLRIAFAAATIGVAVALAALGGVSNAASGVQHAAVAVKHVFVAKNVTHQAKPSPSVDVLGALQPGKTSAADQYLPPGVTPVQAATTFAEYVTSANEDLQTALNCSARSGGARVACLARVRALQRLETRNRASLDAAIAQIAALPAAKQAQVSTLLAIHIQEQQKLAAGQATRRSNCASATYKAAHKALCAKANPASEAAERLKLGQLQLAELRAFLAAIGT